MNFPTLESYENDNKCFKECYKLAVSFYTDIDKQPTVDEFTEIVDYFYNDILAEFI